MKTPDVEFYRKLKADFITNMKRREPKWETFSSDLSLFCACTGLPVFVAMVFHKKSFQNLSNNWRLEKNQLGSFMTMNHRYLEKAHNVVVNKVIKDLIEGAKDWEYFVGIVYTIYGTIGPELAIELRARFEAENEIYNSPLAKALREGGPCEF